MIAIPREGRRLALLPYVKVLSSPNPTGVVGGRGRVITRVRGKAERQMAVAVKKDMKAALAEAQAIQGFTAVAVVDLSSGMVLDKAGGAGLDLDVAAEGNSEVVRAKLRVKEQLGIKDEIEDILISLTNQYHLIRILSSDSNVFIYLVLNRAQANLAMARRTLQKVDEGLVV